MTTDLVETSHFIDPESDLETWRWSHLPSLITPVSAPGNTFYLVMPTEQGESVTDEPNDPPTPTVSHFPPPPDEMMSPQTHPDEEAPASGPDRREETRLEREEGTSQSQAAHQSHVIKNVDAIFHTIEDLMSKLRQLKVGSVFQHPAFQPCVFCRSSLFVTTAHSHVDFSPLLRRK